MLLNKAIEQICQAVTVPAFANHGNHCIFFWQNNGELTILAICTEEIECTSPEQISIAFSALGSGTGGNPGRSKQLFSIPRAAIQEEETEAVQFSQRERQATRAEGIAQRVALPGWAFDAQRSEKARRKILHQIAACAPLNA